MPETIPVNYIPDFPALIPVHHQPDFGGEDQGPSFWADAPDDLSPYMLQSGNPGADTEQTIGDSAQKSDFGGGDQNPSFWAKAPDDSSPYMLQNSPPFADTEQLAANPGGPGHGETDEHGIPEGDPDDPHHYWESGVGHPNGLLMSPMDRARMGKGILPIPLLPPPRVPFSENFPKVVIQQPNAAKMKVTTLPDYSAAKGGDQDAATRLVDTTINPAKVTEIRNIIGDRSPVFLPVIAARETPSNAIPQSYAQALGKQLGAPVSDSISQVNRPQRTGSNGLYRMTNPAIFDGPIDLLRPYFLVDDHITQGGTLADLRSHVVTLGGSVIGATTLTGNPRSSILAPQPKALGQLRTKFPGLEDWWQKQFGYGFDALTQSEALYLGKYGSTSRIQETFSPPRNPSGQLGPGGDTDPTQ